MKTVGQILKETREAKLYTLDIIEKHTKIRKELLAALEADDYEKLPPATFIQGFIKNYGNFLGLSSEKLLAIFRRDFEAKRHPPQVLESFTNPLKTTFRITPSRIIGATITLIIILFFGYLWFEYRQFLGNPNLTISSPTDQLSIEIPKVLVEGSTDMDTKVFVNNQEIVADKEGKFRQEITLSGSLNKIIITAESKFGKKTTIERTVFVKK